MQLRLRPTNKRNLINRSVFAKSILFVLIFFLAIFLLDKIKMPTPSKFIKQELSNDKIVTVK